MATRWHRQFFASTRGRIVALLCQESRTVDELTQALGVTDNAIRSHLATLERDGFVRQGATRRGAGKPAYAYELTAEAERLFPKAYGPILHQVLDVLAKRMPATALEDVLREVGHRLAAEHPSAGGDLRQRVGHAVALLGELGGLAELHEQDGSFLIQGHNCPLAAAVPGHPEVCRLAETLLADVIGAPVRERCERGESLRCRFEISAADDR